MTPEEKLNRILSSEKRSHEDYGLVVTRDELKSFPAGIELLSAIDNGDSELNKYFSNLNSAMQETMEYIAAEILIQR